MLLDGLEQKQIKVIRLDLLGWAGALRAGRKAGPMNKVAFWSLTPGPWAWPCITKAAFSPLPAAVSCQLVPAGRPAEALRDPVLPDPQCGECREYLQVR